MPPPDDDEKWWCEAFAGDGTVLALRRHTLNVRLREEAERIAERWHACRSVLLGVAQYWDDQADDQVHVEVYASERNTPDWPHDHVENDDEDDLDRSIVPGEKSGDLCRYCGRTAVDYLNWGYGELVPAFEAYCHERGTQWASDDENSRPYAIARKNEHGRFDVECVGRIVRPWLDLPRDHPEPLPLDDTARVLLDKIAQQQDVHASRHILADHWLERGDLRGHYLALALHEGGSAEVDEQMFTLWAEHHRAWLGGLAPFLPRGGMIFDRGVLTGAEVYVARDREQNFRRSADDFQALAALESLRFLPGSRQRIGRAMRHLKKLGPLGDDALFELTTIDARFDVEDLELDLQDPSTLGFLDEAANLPRLRVLRLRGEAASLEAIAALQRARALELIELPFEHLSRFGARSERSPALLRFTQFDTDAQRLEGWSIQLDPTARTAVLERTALAAASRLDSLLSAAALVPASFRIEPRPGLHWDPRPELVEELIDLRQR